jgi:phage terminase large subunit GpA-like protein
VLPTADDCRDYTVSDIEPIFEASPVLRGMLSDDTEEGGRNTLLNLRYSGGSLKVVTARAPRNLRRHTVRVLLIDEADACEAALRAIDQAGRNADPIVPNRKIIVGSTPIYTETSHVLRSYEQSDQRIYECPCPSCGGLTEIQWQHIEWPVGSGGQGAGFRCPHCAELIDERHKAAMVAAGSWRITRPEVQGHRRASTRTH